MQDNWSRDFVDWLDGDTAYISVPFTWGLHRAHQRAVWYKAQGYRVRAGGPAVLLMPEQMSDVAEVNGVITGEPITRHNPNATFTTRGCIRKCAFCAVPKIEGEFREIKDFVPRPIVCDNNFLASSKAHFDKVIDALKHMRGVDFNQGLDSRLLTKYHVSRLAETDAICRLAWDSMSYGNQFMAAYEKLIKGGIQKKRIRAYILIGFNDTPEDALLRLRICRQLRFDAYPMRYQPLDSLERNSYVGPHWTDDLLKKYAYYWGNMAIFGGIPWEEYLSGEHAYVVKTPETPGQMQTAFL